MLSVLLTMLFLFFSKHGQTSQVAKCRLFKSFHKACEAFQRNDLLLCSTYKEAKENSKDFQAAKQLMKTKFKALGYGTWLTKPVEEEMFSLTKSDLLT